MKYVNVAFGIVLLSAFASAAATCTGPTSSVCSAMASLCGGIQTLIPVASMLMLVIAAVIYAAGQMMGAETRARANVWATAALVGALIGVLIVAIAPAVLNSIYGGSGTSEIGASICGP